MVDVGAEAESHSNLCPCYCYSEPEYLLVKGSNTPVSPGAAVKSI